MAAPRLIPCLDVSDGRVVKGIQFQNLRDAGDPVTQASMYQDQGADEIVILDVSATPEGRGHAVETTSSVRQVLSIPLTVGGGVRKVEDALALLEAGADKVAVNSAAVKRPELIGELADRFGSQCTVLAVDAARRGDGRWEVVVDGGRVRTGRDVEGWVRSAAVLGAGEILLTSWDQDGTRSGYDLDLIKVVTAAVDIPVIASGGADNADDLEDALSSGATAALIASILHDGVTTVGSLKRQLLANGTEVRP
ncbi:MAG: imidazole glycerol phosphate synthase subunit HisF [Actinomycetota bacterium]|nr:imidazole glycerol phosphate synthase subunit HisF [Actinomycetota bacterium]